jgi:hypothetical protein
MRSLFSATDGESAAFLESYEPGLRSEGGSRLTLEQPALFVADLRELFGAWSSS